MAPEQPQRKPKTALRLWLLVVGGFRAFGIGLAYVSLDSYREELYAGVPEQITPVFGRLFMTWTSMSLVCCLLTAWNPWNAGLRVATMYSFASAIALMAYEYSLGNIPLAQALRPIGVAPFWAGALVPSLLFLAYDHLTSNDDAPAAPAKKRS